jgi:hypothetical protein
MVTDRECGAQTGKCRRADFRSRRTDVSWASQHNGATWSGQDARTEVLLSAGSARSPTHPSLRIAGLVGTARHRKRVSCVVRHSRRRAKRFDKTRADALFPFLEEYEELIHGQWEVVEIVGVEVGRSPLW